MFRNKHFQRKEKPKKIIDPEALLTEKNEWGDYKIKSLVIPQLQKKKVEDTKVEQDVNY